MTVARHLRITGRVQGVFYRAWTKEQAGQLDVSGWVRNCDDGSVEAHLEGSEAAVQQLVEKMRRGPIGARVDGIEPEAAEPEGFTGFDVRH